MPEKASEDETQSHQRERQKTDLGGGATTQSTLDKNTEKETEPQSLKKLTLHPQQHLYSCGASQSWYTRVHTLTQAHPLMNINTTKTQDSITASQNL